MKQVLFTGGNPVVEDVPIPRADRGSVVVSVKRSTISSGTELSGLRSTATPLWKKIVSKRENIEKGIAMVRSEGLKKTWELAQRAQASVVPTGYSAAGVVVEVGEGVQAFAVGDRVACAGSQQAFHAEFIRVPVNLVVPVPASVGWDEAATVTLGAIALQGVRRANPTLGEVFVVIGLGILGQLTSQLLRANGCRSIGIDLDESRLSLAKSLGMELAVCADDGDQVQQVARLTNGLGADGVIITAASASDEIISAAFRMCRKKGRVVLIGDVGLDLKRADFYEKELDFLISASYGPGRYDRRYEDDGVDYPVGYVRWTENRNLSEYLRLIAERRVEIKPLIASTVSVENAAEAFAALSASKSAKPLVLLSYADSTEFAKQPSRILHRTPVRSRRAGAIRIGVIGAGNFAAATHLPNVRGAQAEFELRGVQSHTGHKATAVAKQFGAAYSTTDPAEIIGDPEIDAVIIATRHDLHAGLALAGLRAGKHVLVEKPLAINQAELAEIRAFFAAAEAPPVLFTGFNRRFSPYASKLREWLGRRTNPVVMTYSMNAGYLPADHWVHGYQGGGRNVGEACHIYDLFAFLVGATPSSVSARAIRPATGHYLASDNFAASLSFPEGSIASLTYTALGNPGFPKERLELFADGKVIVLEDYREMKTFGGGGPNLKTGRVEKGHREELFAFASAIKNERDAFPVDQQLAAMETAFAVEREINP